MKNESQSKSCAVAAGAKAIINNGDAPNRAKCAANAYLDMNFCTFLSVCQAHSDRSAEAVVIIILAATIVAGNIAELVFGAAINVNKAIDHIIHANATGRDIATPQPKP